MTYRVTAPPTPTVFPCLLPRPGPSLAGKGRAGTRPPALDSLPRVGEEAESRPRPVAELTAHGCPRMGAQSGHGGLGAVCPQTADGGAKGPRQLSYISH